MSELPVRGAGLGLEGIPKLQVVTKAVFLAPVIGGTFTFLAVPNRVRVNEGALALSVLSLGLACVLT
jgi:hypothetical protein